MALELYKGITLNIENYERFEPYFKPDYSPETLECNNYITHFVVVKKDLIERVGMLNSHKLVLDTETDST